MSVEVNPEAIQKVEHSYRMEETRLKEIMRRKYDIEKEEGESRCRLQRLENDKYRILSGRNI